MEGKKKREKRTRLIVGCSTLRAAQALLQCFVYMQEPTPVEPRGRFKNKSQTIRCYVSLHAGRRESSLFPTTVMFCCQYGTPVLKCCFSFTSDGTGCSQFYLWVFIETFSKRVGGLLKYFAACLSPIYGQRCYFVLELSLLFDDELCG